MRGVHKQWFTVVNIQILKYLVKYSSDFSHITEFRRKKNSTNNVL